MVIMGVIFGMALSVVIFFLWENRKTSNAESKSEKIVSKAERKREHIVGDARKDADDLLQEAKTEAHEIMKKAQAAEERISKTEARVIEREEKIEKRLDQIGQKQDFHEAILCLAEISAMMRIGCLILRQPACPITLL
jgi:vacuolar-type H+-ATPase subunit H